MDIVVGSSRRVSRGERAVVIFAVGLTLGVVLGALLSGGLDRAEQTPRLLTPDERCDALPGERCECWVAPW